MAAERSDKRVLTVAAQDPREVTAFLGERLGLLPQQARELLRQGAVYIGTQRCDGLPASLRPGARVTVYQRSPGAAAVPAPQVVYQDDDLLVVDKPAGLPSQPGRRGGPSLLSHLKASETAAAPRREAALHLLHRLDAEASGLLVLVRREAAYAALVQALVRGEIEREYVAVVAGQPTPLRGRIDLRIGRRSGTAGSQRQGLPPQSPAGQPATTYYQVERVLAPQRSLLRLRLATGRTHQIRIHLAAIGHPIVGDRLYGGPPAARLYLHAGDLRLRHPHTGQPLAFTSPLPAEFVRDA